MHGSRGSDTKLAGVNVKTGLCALRYDEVKRLSAYSICFFKRVFDYIQERLCVFMFPFCMETVDWSIFYKISSEVSKHY